MKLAFPFVDFAESQYLQIGKSVGNDVDADKHDYLLPEFGLGAHAALHV